MPAAFNPDAQETDQTMGAHPSHTSKGSRFGPEDVRGLVVLGTNVQEAVAEYKRGTFTVDDLKQLAFAMGCQVIEGKNTAAMAGEITDLKSKLANALHRAEMAEGAYRGKNEITDESFAAMATKAGFLSKADGDVITGKLAESATALTTAEAALATSQSALASMTTRATTAEAALATASTPKPAGQ